MASVGIYLAGPIDDIDIGDARLWRQQVADLFPSVLFYDPTVAWMNATVQTAARLDYCHRNAIACSSGVLANLTGPGMGFGTIREIEFARSQDKPVAVAYAGYPPLMMYDLVVRSSVEAACEALLGVIVELRSQQPVFDPFGLATGQDDD